MPDEPQPTQRNEFQDHAAKKRTGFLGELWSFLRHRKKWWLLPILIALAILGALILLGGTTLAPFIYPLL